MKIKKKIGATAGNKESQQNVDVFTMANAL